MLLHVRLSLARDSDYVPLSADDFMDAFQTIWDAHINFGTSKSHKNLMGKKRSRDDAMKLVEVVPGLGSSRESLSKREKKRRQREGSGESIANSTGALSAAGSALSSMPLQQPATRPASKDSAPLANKGRFSGTLAAKLLGGGGGGA